MGSNASGRITPKNLLAVLSLCIGIPAMALACVQIWDRIEEYRNRPILQVSLRKGSVYPGEVHFNLQVANVGNSAAKGFRAVMDLPPRGEAVPDEVGLEGMSFKSDQFESIDVVLDWRGRDQSEDIRERLGIRGLWKWLSRRMKGRENEISRQRLWFDLNADEAFPAGSMFLTYVIMDVRDASCQPTWPNDCVHLFHGGKQYDMNPWEED